MFKKKKVINPTDSAYETRRYGLDETRRRLVTSVEKAYILSACINVYPDGPDKNKAIQDAEAAKNAVLNLVAVYDTDRKLFQNWYKIHKDELISFSNPIYTPDTLATSHEVIEIAIGNILEGRANR